MKKNLILLLLLLSSFYAKAQEYDAFVPQTVEIETNGISIDDLYSYAKEWMILPGRIVDLEEIRDERKLFSMIRLYYVQTSYIAEDINTKKVYGLLESYFGENWRGTFFATFKLILSCEENKVALTMCCGYLGIFGENGVPYTSSSTEMRNTDGKIEWERVKKNFTDFFGTAIYAK